MTSGNGRVRRLLDAGVSNGALHPTVHVTTRADGTSPLPESAGPHGRNAILAAVIGLGAAAWAIGFAATVDASPYKTGAVVLGGLVLPLFAFHVDLGVLVLLGLLWARVSDVAVAMHGAPSVVTPVIALLALSLVVQRLGRRHSISAAWFASMLPTVPYLLVVACSYFWSTEPDRAGHSIVVLVKDIAVLWVIAEIVRAYGIVREAATVLVIASGALGVLGIHQHLTGSFSNSYAGFAQSAIRNIAGEIDSYRLGGPLNSPNAFALMLAFTVPLGLAVLRTKIELLSRSAVAVSLCAIVVTIFLTYSRSGAIVLLTVLALSLPRHRIRLPHLLLAAVVLPLALWLAPAQLWQRMETVADPLLGRGEAGAVVDTAVELRLGAQATAVEMFLSHPFLGVGAGNYAVLYQEYARRLPIRAAQGEFTPHNRYLEILAETGIVGFLAFGAMMTAALSRLRRARGGIADVDRVSHDRLELISGLETALIGIAVAMIFAHADYPRFFWIMFALVMAASSTGPTGVLAHASGEHPDSPPEARLAPVPASSRAEQRVQQAIGEARRS